MTMGGGAVVCKAGKVQNSGYVVPHPHVLGRTATGAVSTGDRCPVGGVAQAECAPGREDGKLENLAKTVSAVQ